MNALLTRATWGIVPNAPCGVESPAGVSPFLRQSLVPNAPCGVERTSLAGRTGWASTVPNAPCGVESALQTISLQTIARFLMHRVELKGPYSIIRQESLTSVPNAPCGVES